MRKVDPSRVYRLLYPTVPVIVAASSDGATSAMPVASLVSLSNEPPLVGFSSSSSHATFQRVTKARSFSVSWLDRRYSGTVEKLGTSSGWEVADKLSATGLHHRPDGSPAVPLVLEASAYLACDLDQVRTFGDHELVVGRVRDAQADEDFSDYWGFKRYSPILYTGLGRPAADEGLPIRPP